MQTPDFTTAVRRGPRRLLRRPPPFVSGGAGGGAGGSAGGSAPVDDATDARWWAMFGGADDEDDAEIVSGSALQTAPADDAPLRVKDDDLLDTVAEKLRIPRINPEEGFVRPLTPFDQGSTRQCVASATCTALYLAAVLRAPPASVPHLRKREAAPSVTYAYHAQQRLECLETARVTCGNACGGECEDGGTVMSYMIRVWRDGVPFEAAWPMERARDAEYIKRANSSEFLSGTPHYRLTGFHRMTPRMPRGALVEQLLLCVRSGLPVVLNLVGYGNQERFSQDQANGCRPGAAWSDACHVMPPPEASTRMPQGHAVVLVGANEKRRLFRIRNSYGPSWGCFGDFALAFDALGSEAASPQIHGALVVSRVQIENL